MNSKKEENLLGVYAAIFYTTTILIANIISTKLIVVPFLGWATDAGTLVYPLTFTLRDLVHRTMGKSVSRKIVLFAAGMCVVLTGFIWIAHLWPADSTWANDAAYAAILLSVPRIIAASLIAQIVSELVDTEIFSWLYKFGPIKASFGSNLPALVIDSVIFSGIAFTKEPALLQIIGTNILLKLVISIMSLPLVKATHKEVSKEDI